MEAAFMRRTSTTKMDENCDGRALLLVSAASSFADVVDDLIDDAFQNYPGIKSKQMTQKSAEKEVLAAKLNFLPAVTVSAQPATRLYGDVSSKNRKADPVTVISVKTTFARWWLVFPFANEQSEKVWLIGWLRKHAEMSLFGGQCLCPMVYGA